MKYCPNAVNAGERVIIQFRSQVNGTLIVQISGHDIKHSNNKIKSKKSTF